MRDDRERSIARREIGFVATGEIGFGRGEGREGRSAEVELGHKKGEVRKNIMGRSVANLGGHVGPWPPLAKQICLP